VVNDAGADTSVLHFFDARHGGRGVHSSTSQLNLSRFEPFLKHKHP
jgi:hypothetical protein